MTPPWEYEKVFHVVIDRTAFMALFELLAGTLECPEGLSPLYGRNSVFLENSKEHCLYSLCSYSLWELGILVEKL